MQTTGPAFSFASASASPASSALRFTVKPHSIRVPNPFNGFGRLFVGVGKPSAPKISPDKLAKLRGVHLFAFAWQVSAYVMAPDLLLWQACYTVA
jgi:hypothetical protein